MAPPQLRGRLNQLFQIILTFAIFAAQVCLASQATASHMHPARSGPCCLCRPDFGVGLSLLGLLIILIEMPWHSSAHTADKPAAAPGATRVCWHADDQHRDVEAVPVGLAPVAGAVHGACDHAAAGRHLPGRHPKLPLRARPPRGGGSLQPSAILQTCRNHSLPLCAWQELCLDHPDTRLPSLCCDCD